ncbi:MAG: flagellar hook capping FlgD N-terminal domain-containing protein [Terracidiphilus sp.]
MAALAGILNHRLTSGQALTGTGATLMASPAAATSGTSSTSSSDSSSATISANDFLTLLVTEMKNQDPTANTDPNEYINQLVNVNSLEQLIDINQTLTTDLGSPPTSSTGSSASGQANGATANVTGKSANGASTQVNLAAHKGGKLTAAQSAASGAATARASTFKHAPGNLSIPEAKPAAHRVARALDGRTHAKSITGGPSGAQ